MHKQKYTLQERTLNSTHLMDENPDKIVLIVERHKKSTLPQLPVVKFLCSKDHPFRVVQKLLEGKINHNGSLFMFVKGKIPHPQTTMRELYQEYHDYDGCLYMEYDQHQSL